MSFLVLYLIVGTLLIGIYLAKLPTRPMQTSEAIVTLFIMVVFWPIVVPALSKPFD